MSIDLSQFFEVFFEESFEGLDAMESELLNLTPGEADSETLNTIFRAAHSIKGGSGTFGFTSVSDFTHVLETLLDQIRQGQRQLEAQHVNLLLRSVDCLREMLQALQSEQEPELDTAKELQQQFEEILGLSEGEVAANENEASASPSQQAETNTYQILFKPHHHLFKTGNEPLFMLSDLGDLGSIEVEADLSAIPEIQNLQGDECFMSWKVFLQTEATQEQIKEVFEWVEDDADIDISLCGGLFPEQESSAPTEPLEHDDAAQQSSENEPVAQATQAPASKGKVNKAKSNESTSIRVGIDKIDSLINMVGELVITQSMLSQLGEQEVTENTLAALQEGLAQLAHNTRDLQENVMRIRMLPISFVFSRFPRLVRDISQKLGKQVELKILGEGTELDKTVMEKISDPMVHLVRNSLDHGLETPEQRKQSGKPEIGTVTLNAFHQGGNIVIEIMDDGRGLNTEKIREKAIANGLIDGNEELSDDDINELIFEPGFSTADEVSDISGRGVGMDVVRQNISSLSGSIEVVSTPGTGSTFTIRLPLTLAILDGQLVRIAEHTYIVPLITIVESLQIDTNKVSRVGKSLEVLRLRDEYIPILRLYQLFNHHDAITELDKALLVVVECDNQKVGLLVDDLLAQQQVVIKSLEANYQKVDGVSGATILGDGRVSLIVDIAGLTKMAGLKKPGAQEALIDAAALHEEQV
ncbi:chemotaxis protein CheA [Pseudoalteromonas ruthenica]|uniref:Chemotaxis protein CheA n=1 Tax=Pseudoalteromonas ruthenica TaxID=151081 RepID=A0A0F4PQA9_9GAMM|nr:chemotaxis protein CheA [Pseudoalteromonas ruthenica]KJY97592.1 chemotaxis protein [Pseudoalteromonas ruthenica]KJZ01619.1 chemotaxis protein [Pseudoalteromonas ruthenica]TMO88991.1 chemotaxis protein CheA [Pseudoalteromonas ruthenica]TMO94988.1 chemotaxis protein CheA [Pseudoalteromonas ruthenica]TMO96987.1 chemotaxis protein CheA [Pseudoalteromonas ruthenica]